MKNEIVEVLNLVPPFNLNFYELPAFRIDARISIQSQESHFPLKMEKAWHHAQICPENLNCFNFVGYI